MTDPTPLPEVPRWHLCRQCGMVRDIRGQAHSEYGRYEEQGPYFIREADHLTAMRQQRESALREALAAVEATGGGSAHGEEALAAIDAGKALSAARDAVAAECIAHHGYTPGQTCPYCTDALAAIDALVKGSENNE